jgi:hypothetical protein
MKRILSTLSQKWPEYLIESIVIVASILGAYALDNWNTERIETRKAHSFLAELADELKASEKFLNECISFHQKELAHIQSIKTKYYSSEGDSLLLKMIMQFSDTAKTKRFLPPRIVLDHLMESGSLEYIPSISKPIRHLVKDYDEASGIERSNAEFSNNAQMMFRSSVDPLSLRSTKPIGFKEHAMVAGWFFDKNSEQYLRFFQWMDLLEYYHGRNLTNYSPLLKQINSLSKSIGIQ